MTLHNLILALSPIMLIAVVWFFFRHDISQAKEKYLVKKRIRTLPSDHNTEAIRSIQQLLEGRPAFRFVVLGDSQHHYKTFEKIAADALTQQPDFIIHTGDFTRAGGFIDYRIMLDILRGIRVPLVALAGNHDIKQHGMRLFRHAFGPLDFYFDLHDIRFICINNVTEAIDSGLHHIHPDYAIEGLQNGRGLHTSIVHNLGRLVRKKDHNLLFMHAPIPLELFRFRSFSRNADTLISTIRENAAKIDRIFAGHIHSYGETELEGIPCIVSGGAGGNLYWEKEGFVRSFNYIIVDVGADKTIRHRVCFVG